MDDLKEGDVGSNIRKIQRLKRRAEHLRNRIGIEMTTRKRDCAYDLAELSALEWAIGICEEWQKNKTSTPQEG